MREEIEDEPEMAITPVEVNDANLFGEFPDDTDESFDSDTDSNEDVRELKSECPFNILEQEDGLVAKDCDGLPRDEEKTVPRDDEH